MKGALSLIPFLAMTFMGMTQNHYWLPNAQQQPQMVFPLWIESGDGQTDVLYFGYDTEAKGGNPNGADSIFGEGYELVDTSKFVAYISSSGLLDTNKVIKRDIGKGMGGSILLHNARFPVTFSWDPTLFYSDSMPYHTNEGWPKNIPKAIGEIWCSNIDPNYNNCTLSDLPSFIFPEDPLIIYPEHGGRNCFFPYPVSLPYDGYVPCIAYDEVVFYGDTTTGTKNGPKWMLTWFFVLEYGQPTGLQTNEKLMELIAIAPNPFKDILVITSKSKEGNNHTFELYNAYGQLVRTMPLVAEHSVLERGNLPSGIFFYRVLSQNRQLYSGKLIIDKI